MSKTQQRGTGSSESNKSPQQKAQETILKPSVQQNEKDILDNLPGRTSTQSEHDVEQDHEQTRNKNSDRQAL